MGKEVKIGLAVIGVLLCVFGGVLFYRLRGEQPATGKKVAAAVKKATKSKDAKKENPDSKKTKDDKPKDDRHKRFAGRTAWDTSTIDRQPESTEQAPDVEKSPYRNRATSDRYGRVVDETPADDRVAATDDAVTEADDEDDSAADDVAMPRDRFAQPLGGMAFSDDATDEDSAASDDDADTADAPRLSLDRIDRFAGGREMAKTTDDQTFDAEVTEDAAAESSPTTDGDSDLPSALHDRYAQRRYEPGGLRERATRQAEQIDDAENAGDDEPVNAADEPVSDNGQADSYVVEPHDNFWRISQKVYGTGAYYKALEEYNRRQSGERKLVNAGDVLSVPSIDVLRDNYPDLCPKPRNVASQETEPPTDRSPRASGRRSRTYTVVEGDTLFDIARRELGKATRWAEIYRLNRDQLGEDFNNLSPGMELVLPVEVSRPAPMASRPQSNGYRR